MLQPLLRRNLKASYGGGLDLPSDVGGCAVFQFGDDDGYSEGRVEEGLVHG